MKDLGVANVILNINLLRGGDGEVRTLQSQYIKKGVEPIWV